MGVLSLLVSSPWPFAYWGIDIVGPLPRGKGVLSLRLYRRLFYKVGRSRDSHKHNNQKH